MSSDIVLTAALRNNLLSLQNTQRLIDQTQLRLATGLKVNSALDNPQNFFTAEALNNRASDLTRLLDGIGQSVRSIESASNGVTALSSLINQAESVVNSARDELAASKDVARIVGDVDLSDTILTNIAGIDAADQFTITVVGNSGAQVTETIIIQAADTAFNLAARITDQFADNQDGEITATVTDGGFLSIQSADGRSFRIQDSNVGSGTEVTDASFTALGFDDQFAIETAGANTRAATTVISGSSVKSVSLYEASGNVVEAGDLLTGTYEDENGATAFAGFAVGDTIDFNINLTDGTTVNTAFAIGAAANTFQALVDDVNRDANNRDYIELGFDSSTGQLTITSLSDEVANVELDITAAGAATFDIGLGDPTGLLDPVALNNTTEERVFYFNSSTESLDNLAADYNEIRSQIDGLVADASYRGINLLSGDNLETFFNEDRTNSLTTSGVDFTANGLALNEVKFRGSSAIEASATQIDKALQEIRSFGTTLANNLSIIQTRRDFTEGTINTLESGADDLVVADQNEEGANLLALQTRQALGTTSLSLASQSQQSVLRLF